LVWTYGEDGDFPIDEIDFAHYLQYTLDRYDHYVNIRPPSGGDNDDGFDDGDGDDGRRSSAANSSDDDEADQLTDEQM
jgi:hypothetical protein